MATSDWSTVWPNGARTAITITIDNMGEAADLDRGLWPDSKLIGQHPSVTVALPQMQSILDRHGIKVTYFVESWNLDVYPDTIAEKIIASGHEIGWHAYRHEAWYKLPNLQAEKDNFERSVAKMDEFATSLGSSHEKLLKYRGFRPPGGIFHGDRTLSLCRDYGLEYISPAGENAAIVSVGKEKDSILVLPFRWRTVDAYYYMESFSGLREIKKRLPKEPQSEGVMAKEMFQEIDKAIESGGYLSVLFHPFLTTTPERLQAFETVVNYIAGKRDSGDVWIGRCCDVQEKLRGHEDLVGDEPEYDTTQWR